MLVPRLPPPPSPQDELAISVSAHIPALEVAVTSEQARLMGAVVSRCPPPLPAPSRTRIVCSGMRVVRGRLTRKIVVPLPLCGRYFKTGGVITTAGVIMVLAFGTLMLSSQLLLVQCGFLLSFSVLLDTFVVRSLLVPAIMFVLGERVYVPWSWSGVTTWVLRTLWFRPRLPPRLTCDTLYRNFYHCVAGGGRRPTASSSPHRRGMSLTSPTMSQNGQRP